MTTYHEPMYLSDILISEVSRGWTTQNVKVKTATNLAIGTVLFYVQDQDYFTGGENSGNGVVAGILADNVKASDDVQTGLAIVRGAVVATENLIFPADTSDEQKKNVISGLNNMGIMTQGEILPVVPAEPMVSPPSSADSIVPLMPEPIIEEDKIPFAD